MCLLPIIWKTAQGYGASDLLLSGRGCSPVPDHHKQYWSIRKEEMWETTDQRHNNPADALVACGVPLSAAVSTKASSMIRGIERYVDPYEAVPAGRSKKIAKRQSSTLSVQADKIARCLRSAESAVKHMEQVRQSENPLDPKKTWLAAATLSISRSIGLVTAGFCVAFCHSRVTGPARRRSDMDLLPLAWQAAHGAGIDELLRSTLLAVRHDVPSHHKRYWAVRTDRLWQITHARFSTPADALASCDVPLSTAVTAEPSALLRGFERFLTPYEAVPLGRGQRQAGGVLPVLREQTDVAYRYCEIVEDAIQTQQQLAGADKADWQEAIRREAARKPDPVRSAVKDRQIARIVARIIAVWADAPLTRIVEFVETMKRFVLGEITTRAVRSTTDLTTAYVGQIDFSSDDYCLVLQIMHRLLDSATDWKSVRLREHAFASPTVVSPAYRYAIHAYTLRRALARGLRGEVPQHVYTSIEHVLSAAALVAMRERRAEQPQNES